MQINWRQRVKLSNRYRRQWMPIQSSFSGKASVLLTAVMLLLTGCVPAQSVCPRVPELTARVPLGPNSVERMETFLSGKLPSQTNGVQP